MMKGFFAIAATLAVLAIPTAALGGSTTTGTLSGTAEWSLSFEGGFLTIPTITPHGTFAGKLGKGTYAGALTVGDSIAQSFCFYGPDCRSVTGAITFTSRRGSFTGVVQPGSSRSWFSIASNDSLWYTLTLRVGNGTRGFARVGGVLTLTYNSVWWHYYGMNETGDVELFNYIDDHGTLSGFPR